MKVARARPVGRSFPPADSHQHEKACDRGKHDHHVTLEEGGGFARKLQRFAKRIDQKESEQPDREREHEVHAVPAEPAHRRVEHQANGDRQDANEDAEQRLRAEADRAFGGRGHRHRDLVVERRTGVGDDTDGMRLSEYPRVWQPDPGGRAAADGAGRLLRELPIGIVHLNLRDRHRLGAAGPHQNLDALGTENRALEGQVFDGRGAVAETADEARVQEPCDRQR